MNAALASVKGWFAARRDAVDADHQPRAARLGDGRCVKTQQPQALHDYRVADADLGMCVLAVGQRQLHHQFSAEGTLVERHGGDRVRMQAMFDDGRDGPFGAIEQRVVPAR